jgi:hypothetical protein
MTDYKAQYAAAHKIASQFRMGNLVLINGKVTEIEAIDVYGINSDECQGCVDYAYRFISNYANDVLEFIPLTEEWLLKFGFEKSSGTSVSFQLESKYFDIRYYNQEISIISDRDDLKMIQVKYVHQLQNLYFALVGEELTIK